MIVTQENTWIGGMNQDLAKSLFKHNQYYIGDNIRLLTKVGLSTGNIANEQGTLSSFIVPQYVQKLYKISLITTPLKDSLIVNGQVVASIVLSTTIDSLYNSVITNAALPIANGDYRVFNNGDSLAIVGLDVELSVTSIEGTIIVEQVVDKQTQVKIIGWTYLLDDIILFTKSYSISVADALAPQTIVDAPSPGQVWKLAVDSATGIISGLINSTLVPSVHLIYNNQMEFDWDGRVKGWGNYETPDVAKVYFTDTINPFRHININDPNLLGYPLNRIELVPEVNFAAINVQGVTHGGVYNSGMVQYSYCLFNLYGSQSSYSPVTNFIHLAASSESIGDSHSYKGTAIDKPTSKAVFVQVGSNIDQIDKRFQYIRLVALYVDSLTGTPTIGIVTERPIPTTGQMVVVDSGHYEGTISHNEFLILSTFSFVCNDIAAKDNILFAAGIEEEYYEVDWDARAYRFKAGSTPLSKISDSEGSFINVNTSFVNSSTGNEIPEVYDCILSKTLQSIYKYKANGTTLGAEGRNVEVEFITHNLPIDNYIPTFNGTGHGGSGATDYLINKFGTPPLNSMCNPIIQESYTGYMRDEIYRFFISFENNKGFESYAKWICDIKMPSALELAEDTTFIDDGVLYAKVLGVRFKIKNIPSDAISYKILRCDRSFEDKTILAQGLYQPSMPWEGKRVAIPSPIQGLESPYDHNLGNLISPETMIEQKIQLSGGDRLELIGYYKDTYTCDIVIENEDEFKPTMTVQKCMQIEYVSSVQSKLIEDACLVTPGGVSEYICGPFSYINYGWGPTGCSFQYRCTNLLVLMESKFVPIGAMLNKVILVNYVRDNEYARYGGNTFSSRSYNTPISCGISSILENVWFDVYGGDTFIDMYDCLASPMDLGDVNFHNANVVYFPVETSINLSLRHDESFNRLQSYVNRVFLQEVAGYHSLNGDTSYSITQPTDLYLYNSVYSRSSDLQPSFVEPILSSNNTSFSSRVISTQLKINGQIEDSWTKFGIAAILDVEGKYGKITSLTNFNEFLMFFQETAFGVLSVNQKALQVPDETGASLTLGKGGVLDDFRYISRGSGCVHRFVPQIVTFPEDTLHFYDYHNNKLLTYTTSKSRLSRNDLLPLSSLEGMSSYLRNMDRTYMKYDMTYRNRGVHSVINQDSDRVIYTFLSGDNKYTLAYNTLLNSFEGTFPFTPNAYLAKGDLVFSSMDILGSQGNQVVWIHGNGEMGKFYDTYYDSKIVFVVNTLAEYSKLMNTLHYNLSVTNPDGSDDWDRNFDTIRIYNEYQDSGTVPLVYDDNAKRLFRVWRVKLPRENVVASSGIAPKLRSQTAIIELTFFNNSANQRFQLENVMTKMTVR